MSIYFKTDKKYNNLKDLLEDFCKPYTKTTFLDKRCKSLQCNGGRSRSIEDLLELANTYLKDISEKELLSTLQTLNISNFDILYYCPEVNKVVFHSYDELPSYHDTHLYKDFLSYFKYYHGFNSDRCIKEDDDGYEELEHIKNLLDESI